MSLSSGKTSWTCSCCAVYAAVSVSVPRSWRQELLCRESSRQTPLVPQWPCTGHSRALREARGAAGDTPAGEERPVWKSEEQPCEHPCGGRSGARRRSGTGAGAVSVQADDSTSNGNEGVNGNGSSDADAQLDILFYLVHRSLLSGISDSETLWDGASERARDTGVSKGPKECPGVQSCGVRHSAGPSSGCCRAALSGRWPRFPSAPMRLWVPVICCALLQRRQNRAASSALLVQFEVPACSSVSALLALPFIFNGNLFSSREHNQKAAGSPLLLCKMFSKSVTLHLSPKHKIPALRLEHCVKAGKLQLDWFIKLKRRRFLTRFWATAVFLGLCYFNPEITGSFCLDP